MGLLVNGPGFNRRDICLGYGSTSFSRLRIPFDRGENGVSSIDVYKREESSFVSKAIYLKSISKLRKRQSKKHE